MAVPTLTPSSETSAVALPATGSLTTAQTVSSYAFGIYVSGTSDASSDQFNQYYDFNFVSGAVEQVSYAYKKLGGDVLDVELTEESVYTAYEEAVLEYSYILNVHQAKNSLSDLLGSTTGTFDHRGNLVDLGEDNSLTGSQIQLKYPKFKFDYSKRVADGLMTETGLGGSQRIFSASIERGELDQDYDLQSLLSSSATDDANLLYKASDIGNNKVTIRRVYYKTPHAMWRFYGYYGGLNSVGNMSTYGQYADDSTFEVIPPWNNKLQAMAYEDSIYTRNSHYSYELRNNRLRIYPQPDKLLFPKNIWIEFTVEEDPWEEESDRRVGVDGINNMNTLPYANIPYKSINSIGKQWIRKYALAVVKEMLGQVRGKFATVPIPGEQVTLNAADLIAQAKEEKQSLREELIGILDELVYGKLVEKDSERARLAQETLKRVPYGLYIG